MIILFPQNVNFILYKSSLLFSVKNSSRINRDLSRCFLAFPFCFRLYVNYRLVAQAATGSFFLFAQKEGASRGLSDKEATYIKLTTNEKTARHGLSIIGANTVRPLRRYRITHPDKSRFAEPAAYTNNLQKILPKI